MTRSFCVLYVVLWVFSGLKYDYLFFFPLFKQIVTSRRTPLFQVAVNFQLMRKWEKKRKKSVSNFPVHENCKGSGLIWIHQLKTNQQAGQTITFRSGDVPHLIAFSSCSQSITYTHTACHQQHMNRFVTVTVHFAYRSFHLLQPQAFFPPSPAAIKN